MPQLDYGNEFKKLYESLPPAAQRELIYEQLIPLLNNIQHDKSQRVLRNARKSGKPFKGAPVLDLAAKKVEVNGLLDEITKDMKLQGLVKDETSSRDILLKEVVESIAGWLNDIWVLALEYRIDQLRAHSCLLFSMGVLDHIRSLQKGSCDCSIMYMYVPVEIKDKTGEAVKNFTRVGMRNVEEAILWIWRDVFLSLLSSNFPSAEEAVVEALLDIDGIAGWSSLERILYGGKQRKDRYDTTEACSHSADYDCDDSDDSEFDQLDIVYADHWPNKIGKEAKRLRDLVVKHLVSIFKAAPSYVLYSSILSLSTDIQKSRRELKKQLADLSKATGTACATALEIYCAEKDLDTAIELLDSHSHLLQPRDAPKLQQVARELAASSDAAHKARAAELIEKELCDCISTTRQNLLTTFSGMDKPKHVKTLDQIIGMRLGTDQRNGRVTNWVDAVTTPPGAAMPHPMMFAAMMMGFPLTHAELDDLDPWSAIDIDPSDSDFTELKEEYKPNLKGRWEGWTDAAATLVNGGQGILSTVFDKLLEGTKIFQATDVVDEMITRLQERQSKMHILDALETLQEFAIKQRQRRVGHADGSSEPWEWDSDTPPPLMAAEDELELD